MQKTLKLIQEELQSKANPKQAEVLSRFFKTGKGQYGEGDLFIGIKVPVLRQIAKKYFKETHLNDLSILLNSTIHEERLTSLFILIFHYQKSKETDKKEIVDFYLQNISSINNWDLVDLSAPKILGSYLFKRDKSLLTELALSGELWKQRIAMITCQYFISQCEFKDALKIAEILLNHPHDLIHKAVGWMLREIGKKYLEAELDFLKIHYKNMPRTMLRYAIEKFDENLRQDFLKSRI